MRAAATSLLGPDAVEESCWRETIFGRSLSMNCARRLRWSRRKPTFSTPPFGENLRLARPQAADEAIEEAAQRANAHQFITELPHSYDTFVGERGIQLSGGQRQRLAIARALLKNAPVLILDEATSHLDAVNEQLIHQALSRLAEGRTTLVIAHRLSTIRDADHIVVLDQGRVVEQGSHAVLLGRNGLYSQLVGAQLIGSNGTHAAYPVVADSVQQATGK